MPQKKASRVVGNNYSADRGLEFKHEVQDMFETYAAESLNIADDFTQIMRNPNMKENFVSQMLESFLTSDALSQSVMGQLPFYRDYVDRYEQLQENSINSIVQESALLGYAPIVAYAPFFLKKQWVSCIFKDVLMAEVPDSPVVEYAFERRYIVGNDGKTEYEIPDVFYKPEIMRQLYNEGTGYSMIETPIALTRFSPKLDILTTEFFPDIVEGDPRLELTADMIIFQVIMEVDGTEVTIPCSMKFDITNKRLIDSTVSYTVYDTDGVTVKEVLTDTLYGGMDWKNHTISLYSSEGNITKVCMRGKLANRWNERSLSLRRRVEQKEFIMPESGLRINCPITIEDAIDAMAFQKIDIIADNADVMGQTFAQFQDYGIRQYLEDSYQVQRKAQNGPYGFQTMVVEGYYDTVPYDGYAYKMTDWKGEAKEIVERIVAQLKVILKIEDIAVIMVGHPNTVRFIQDINWVFNQDATIGGTKLNYNFGIITSAQDRIHVITSMNIPETDHLRFIVIPLTNQYITFKHLMYNAVIDRNYRGPIYDKVPNLMSTQRVMTLDVLPVQGKMIIHNTENWFPNTLTRPITMPDEFKPAGDAGADTGGSGNPGGTP